MPKFNHEEKLNNLMKSINPDPEFKRTLRSQILQRAQSTKQAREEKNMTNNTFLKKSIFALAGLGVAALALVVVSQGLLGSDQKVASRLGFGSLPTIQQADGRGSADDSTSMESLNRATSEDQALPAGSGGGGISMASPMIVRPDDQYVPPQVSYTWTGELPEVPAELLVFRDRPLESDRSFLRSLARLTKLSFFSNLNDARIENVSFYSPSKNLQYSADQSGRFNIWSRNYNYDPAPPSSIPSDEELINAANAFLAEQNISTAQYGAPYVDKAWRQYIAKAQTAENSADLAIWAPHDMSVHYPMELDGKPVVGYGGGADPGLVVNVNIKNKTVSGVYGRWETSKDQSLYPTINQDEVVAKAVKGGLNPLWGWYDQPLTPEQEARRQKIDVQLHESYIGIVQQFNYKNNNSESYWIPVYVFKGTYLDQQGTQQDYTTMVPAIAGDFFQEPPIQIMEGRGDASSGAVEITPIPVPDAIGIKGMEVIE